MKPIVLCLGNEVLSDDRFGAEIEAILRDRPELSDSAEVIFAPIAGFYLLDLLAGRPRALIVDTIRTGAEPGSLHQFNAAKFAASKNLTTSHQISLPTALELGRQMGLQMPEVVDILAVEALDLETLSEEMTPAISASVEPAIKLIEKWIHQGQENGSYHD
ncbi:MAG: hydrogenase maturation protease [bacterium]|nr:hydrogenase maturation protease [bacterium]